MLKFLKKCKRVGLQTIKYLFSSAFVIMSGKRRNSNKYLKTLKNRYAGKRCFVIGNGPSLTKEDLELLRNEVTFASNRIYKMFDKTDWRPTFYAVFDESVASDRDVIKNANLFDCEGKFFREQGWYVNHE